MIRAPYELALESRVSGGRETYRFRTADGLHSPESFRAADLLLLERLWNAELGRLLCPEANYGVVGTVLADVADAVRMTETSARAARICERNVRENGVDASVSVSLRVDLAGLDGQFDTVAYAPKLDTALSVGKQRVADALSVLRPGGNLYLAARKHAGFARYEECLRNLSVPVERVARDGDCRLLAATRPPTVDRPTYVTPREIRPTVDGITLSLWTVPGLFSASALDDGTRLLLETATVADGDRVLDLCCGYGAVGTYAGRTADCEVRLTDDDVIATACAECSLRASGVDSTVVTADCVEGVDDRTFDRILCNPPTHAGSGVLADLFDGAHGALASDGCLRVVHHSHLRLRDHLTAFGDVEECHTAGEHTVLRASP